MRELRQPITRASLDELLERAARVLDRVTRRETFQVRSLAEQLATSWRGTELTVEELVDLEPARGGRPSLHDPSARASPARVSPARAPSAGVSSAGGSSARSSDTQKLRVLLLARAESLRATLRRDAPAGPTLAELLRAERTRAANAKFVVDRLAASLDHDGPWPHHEGALRSALVMLAAQMASMLELRILAEGATDPAEAEVLGASRESWIAVARDVISHALGSVASAQRAARDGSARLRPLAGRVVLAIAAAPVALARLTSMLEEAGATTILAESRASALSLLRWFQVDAALCSFERDDPALMRLPAEAREHSPHPSSPLWVALLGAQSELSPENAASLGFDAAIPVSLAEADALSVAMALAIQARKITRRSTS